jgi:hypothetical protein
VSWTDSQLRILRALGHEPYVRAGAVGAAVVGAAFGRDESAGVPGSRPKAAPTSFDALHAAIARAAGGRDTAALALDLERLRREPALKRALWPQLRRMRKEH